MKDFGQVWGRGLLAVATLVATAFTGVDAVAQQTDVAEIAVVPQEPVKPNAPNLDWDPNDPRIVDGGAAAIALLEQWTPSVVVSDVRMPGMSGIELVRRLRDCCRYDVARAAPPR